MTETLDEIVNEAKASFDLKDRLQNRKLRTGKHTLFTDDETGKEYLDLLMAIAVEGDKVTAERTRIADEHAKVHAEVKSIDGDVVLLPETVLDRNAVKEIEGALKVLESDIATLEAQKPALEAKLESTALSFEFRAIPDVIVAAAKRKTLEAYPDLQTLEAGQRKDDADHFYFALLFKDACTKIYDHATGETHTGLNLEGAQSIADYGNEIEFKRLNAAYSEVQFQNAIIYQVTDTPDF